MLTLPTSGIRRSVNKHNVELDIFCDWIEASALFGNENVSTTDVVDTLLEENIYVAQDFAREMVETGWGELERRQMWLGAGRPLMVEGSSVRCVGRWQDFPAPSFCLALSLAQWYPKWAGNFGSDYTDQGALFEDLTKQSLEKLFPEWEIHQTGWTRTHPSKLNGVVKKVASLLHELEGDIKHWTDASANEAGLDLIFFRPFKLHNVGVPLFLLQCASGADWARKLHTPDLRIWGKIVNFAATPKKAFAMPYSLVDDEYSRKCNIVDGLLLDRCRLLSAGSNDPTWVSEDLKNRIVTWLEPRIAKLPRDTQ